MLILLDIDGTMLLARPAGVPSFIQAMCETLEQEIRYEGRRFSGGLDPLIWRGLCADHGVERPHVHHDRFRRRYGELLGAALDAQGGARPLPGVHRLIDALAGRRDVTLGLVTGNYPETGRMKIASIGVDPDLFVATAWGIDASSRRLLPRVALDRLRFRFGRHVRPEDAVVIGDTPKDVDCARYAGCRSLAVTTGLFGVDELREAGADRVVEDLEETDALLDWLLGGRGKDG
ncbi:MAG: HAD family hydrolase [Planctomycetota bacterium JB042]